MNGIRAAKDADILALRDENTVLRRAEPNGRSGLGRPRHTRRLDQTAASSVEGPPVRDPRHGPCLAPSSGTARRWTCPHRRGRPAIDAQVARLVAQMARDNPGWGYQRVQGELLGFGRSVGACTTCRTLRRLCIPPTPVRRDCLTWRRLLRTQVPAVLARDQAQRPACAPMLPGPRCPNSRRGRRRCEKMVTWLRAARLRCAVIPGIVGCVAGGLRCRQRRIWRRS